jgi:hypothetical protein
MNYLKEVLVFIALSIKETYTGSLKSLTILAIPDTVECLESS